MSFKAIETQEDFDNAVIERIRREQEKFSDYDQLKSRNSELETEVTGLKTTISETNEKIKGLDTQIVESNAKIQGYETANMKTRIALQHGLPMDLADRLIGEDEAALKADAERMAGFVKPSTTVPPLKNTEPQIDDDKTSSYKKLLQGLNNKGE